MNHTAPVSPKDPWKTRALRFLREQALLLLFVATVAVSVGLLYQWPSSRPGPSSRRPATAS
jgi:hypothetical protein